MEVLMKRTGWRARWAATAAASLAAAAVCGPVAAAGAVHRPLLALDPDGETLVPTALPASAVLAFGTERYGLSEEVLARADARVSIPMR